MPPWAQQGPPAGAPRPPPPMFMAGEDLPQIPRMNLPPQPMMDSAKEDGPVSVAYGLRPSLMRIGASRPSPATAQYMDRRESERMEQLSARPRARSDIAGWVLACEDPSDTTEANRRDKRWMNVHHNEQRLVYQCISGWILMIWQNEDEFRQGIHGAHRAPRPMAWWDLRKAYDIRVDTLLMTEVQHRLAVLTNSGSRMSGAIYFCVPDPEDVHVWHDALQSLIMEACWSNVNLRDTPAHQKKRWPAACGIAQALATGREVGDLALSILFHCFDLDFDCLLKTGELMVLVRELSAAVQFNSGRAEAGDRDLAVLAAASRMTLEELFERAQEMRRKCDTRGDGRVRKDEFVQLGRAAIKGAVPWW